VSQEVEINLRIPKVTDPLKGAGGWPINNADVRFTKRMHADRVPKAGDAVELMIQPNYTFEAVVTRAEWHEQKAVFIVSCKYAKRSISRPEYVALMEDPAWTMRPLLE